MRRSNGEHLYEKIFKTALAQPEKLCMKSKAGELTYKELWDKTDKLAFWLNNKVHNDKPIVVYGHKNPKMLICFLGCLKAGHAYCPVDISMPKNRICEITEAVGNDIVLATEDITLDNLDIAIVDSAAIDEIVHSKFYEVPKKEWRVKEDDTLYIIFTSGSTGKPKGVEVSARNLENFLNWSSDLAIEYSNNIENVFLNQAPFSFDLSVFDTYTSLYSRGTLVCLDKQFQEDLGTMFDFLQEQNPSCWVSTPSFADMCLADRKFSQELMANLKVFLFCGERLSKDTVLKLFERFPEAKVVNTYGPTESTVAVTAVEITREMLSKENILPIGKPKCGTEILIENEEIVILGDTVAKGYYKDQEKTEKAFEMKVDRNGNNCRAYRTGDKGYYKDGQLYCEGRIDFQVKLHGYRIELGDIENNLLQLSEIQQVAVLPRYEGDKIKNLVAFVKSPTLEGNFKDSKMLKSKLKEKLPSYMIPKNFIYLDEMPLTQNGKLDRKKLEGMVP